MCSVSVTVSFERFEVCGLYSDDVMRRQLSTANKYNVVISSSIFKVTYCLSFIASVLHLFILQCSQGCVIMSCTISDNIIKYCLVIDKEMNVSRS